MTGLRVDTLKVDTTHEEYLCWSRMQAEAGQKLDEIIARKELERHFGDGLFFWGVGNAPARTIPKLARSGIPVRAVFSIMKSKPKTIDTAPSRVVLWRRYIDAFGVDQPLPASVIVTSRADSAKGVKRNHYALICRSQIPLTLHYGEPFYPSLYRNASGTGAPVGASQVTALLKRTETDTVPSGYQVNLSAWLSGSYWVRLTDPLELSKHKQALLSKLTHQCDWETWHETVSEIRVGASPRFELEGNRTLI